MIGSVEIPLTMGYVAAVDAADAELVQSFKWSASHGTRTVYAVRGIRRPDGRKTNRHLGLHESPDLAALAYDDAARGYFGPFAALNFPRPGERAASRKAA